MTSKVSLSIEYGKERIGFAVVYADRKTLEIAVHPDASIVVKAPRGMLLEDIRGRVKRRARWIIKQTNYFRQFEPRTPARRYLGGESHLFLGRQYRLKITKRRDEGVKLRGAFFWISALAPEDTQSIKDLLEEWYKDHAQTVFARRLNECYARARKLNVPFPEISVRQMIRRWGSCGRNGTITLNTSLVKAPVYCIDYVIMHELCHLKVHTHNNGYYRVLSKYMPDWEKRKERLEQVLK